MKISTTYVEHFLSRKKAARLYQTCNRLTFGRRANPRNPQQFLKRGTLTFQDRNVGAGAAVLGSNHVDIRNLETAPLAIRTLREQLTRRIGRRVNYISLNRYPDGAAGIGFHNHREDLDIDTPVLLVSVGAVRTMWVRRMGSIRQRGTKLESGSLFIMPSELNRAHQHGVLPEKNVPGIRYSLNCKCLATV
jgi:2OG-Fe(II) oxygenase superfamily